MSFGGFGEAWPCHGDFAGMIVGAVPPGARTIQTPVTLPDPQFVVDALPMIVMFAPVAYACHASTAACDPKMEHPVKTSVPPER